MYNLLNQVCNLLTLGLRIDANFVAHMMKNLLTTFLLVLFAFSFLSAQIEKKTAFATRINQNDKIEIDGYLDDPTWKKSGIVTEFVQTDPVFQDPVSQKTEVRILYNDRGIYIGAMMYDKEPDKILKELSARDSRGNTDFFGVVFDTYRDGLNAFAFNVTASGVQQDIKISGGNEDVSWDGIWESEVQFLDNGWSVELFIPYLSIRFPNKDIQQWNVNFLREIRRNREQLYWNPVSPAIEGFLNQAGHLDGITKIKSPVRLSITPFVTGYINTNSNPSTGQPTDVTTAYTGGMDLKYGINDAFTLDMTLVPDFGQVISDNQVLNLSPFEIQFDENRQFFKEGTELFDKGNLFYTRRVGGRPVNYFNAFSEAEDGEILIENPKTAQLINATKVSGRTSSGTGIGVFNAVEGEEYAVYQNIVTGEQRSVKTNPYTNYNVLVADQNLPNNSVISLINTNVTRFGSEYNANVTGAFASFKNKNQTYAFGGSAVVANQFFEEETNTGHKYSLSAAKIGGNWRGFIDYSEESDNYNPNDLGILFSPNERVLFTNISYNQYKPKHDKLQRWEIGISPSYSRLYKPDAFVNFGVRVNAFALWKSRNAVGFNAGIEPVESNDYFEPRTVDFSRLYKFPTSWSMGSFFSSDYRKTLALDVNVFYRKFGEDGRSFKTYGMRPRIRVNDRLSFFLGNEYSLSNNEVGFIGVASSGLIVEGAADGDILFGIRDRKILENSLRAQFIFNNKMSLSARVRHYWDQVEYDDFAVLNNSGRLDNVPSIENFNINQNVNFFNIDMIYTWRFAKGSDLIFVWKNNISGSNKDLAASYLSNLSELFDYQQTNSFSLKIVYFLDYDTVFNR